MEKIVFLFLLLLSPCVPVFASEDPFEQTRKSLKDQTFVVETDEDMGKESLNRVSGQYDLGFTLPEQEYHSSSHTRAGPLRYEESQETSSQVY